jgi:hypothetical protein
MDFRTWRIRTPKALFPRGSWRVVKKVIVWTGGLLICITMIKSCVIWWLIADNFYDVRGKAVITSEAARQSGVPSLVCVGKGGPLETSGVYAYPLTTRDESRARYVLCGVPAQDLKVDYQIDEISSMRPWRMHVYVWLERHPELRGACQTLVETSEAGRYFPFDEISDDALGMSSDDPCQQPKGAAAIGYAVAFKKRYSMNTEETHEIRIAPNGYFSTRGK